MIMMLKIVNKNKARRKSETVHVVGPISGKVKDRSSIVSDPEDEKETPS